MTPPRFEFAGRVYSAAAIARALAAAGLPVCPGELDYPEAAAAMVEDLRAVGYMQVRRLPVCRTLVRPSRRRGWCA